MHKQSVKPKVSVVMATYNGENYISHQIESILNDISLSDELVVYDDASTDNTIEIIKSFNDSRIVLQSGRKNLGHVRAFEIGLSHAKNEIIMLSDQDDLWPKGRVKCLIDVFYESDSCLIIASIVNFSESGYEEYLPATLDDSFSGFFDFFWGKASVYGCAMAFKKDLLRLILPIPQIVYSHDHWISICSLCYSQVLLTKYIAVRRRLHKKNLTPRSREISLRTLCYRIFLPFLYLIASYRARLCIKLFK